MINEQGNGALKMLDLCSFDKSLKSNMGDLGDLDTANNGKWWGKYSL